MAIIKVSNLRRSFRTSKKEEGLSGSLKHLIRPRYQDFEALKGVSFEIEEGSFVGLIGANGAGKTTLLKVLSGLIPPTSGDAVVMEEDPFRRSLSFRKRISLVMGQKAQLWWDLPATDAFDLIQAIYEIPKKDFRERVQLLAETLDVKSLLQTQIRRLSLGERMKMELIGALLHWPKIIFLDEPTIGLDVLAAQKLRDFLFDFNQKQKATLILTSHNMEDIQKLCPRIIILQEGTIVYDGPPDELTRGSACQVTVLLLEEPTLDEIAKISQVPIQQITEQKPEEGPKKYTFQIERDQWVSLIQRLMTQYQVKDMTLAERSLESVIQELFSQRPARTEKPLPASP